MGYPLTLSMSHSSSPSSSSCSSSSAKTSSSKKRSSVSGASPPFSSFILDFSLASAPSSSSSSSAPSSPPPSVGDDSFSFSSLKSVDPYERPTSPLTRCAPASFRKDLKRIRWTPELHARFLEVYEKLGPDAVPSKILQHMGDCGLSRNQIASHLQKHRGDLENLLAQSKREKKVRGKRQKLFFPDMPVRAPSQFSRTASPPSNSTSPAPSQKRSSSLSPKRVAGSSSAQTTTTKPPSDPLLSLSFNMEQPSQQVSVIEESFSLGSIEAPSSLSANSTWKMAPPVGTPSAPVVVPSEAPLVPRTFVYHQAPAPQYYVPAHAPVAASPSFYPYPNGAPMTPNQTAVPPPPMQRFPGEWYTTLPFIESENDDSSRLTFEEWITTIANDPSWLNTSSSTQAAPSHSHSQHP